MSNEETDKSTIDILWELHRGLAEAFLTYLQSEKDMSNVKASMLNCIRSFLADNGVVVSHRAHGIEKGLTELLSYPFPSTEQ